MVEADEMEKKYNSQHSQRRGGEGGDHIISSFSSLSMLQLGYRQSVPTCHRRTESRYMKVLIFHELVFNCISYQ